MTIKRSILLLGLADTAEKSAVAHFTAAGHGVVTARPGADADALIRNPQLDVVYVQGPRDSEAIALMRRVRAVQPVVPVVLVCGQESAPIIREAWHAGAADVIALPFAPQALDSSLERSARKPENADQTGAEAQ